MANSQSFLAPSGSARIRDPLSNAQQNGTVINPPRYADIGGLSGPSKGLKRNRYTIKKPGGTAG